MMQGNKTISGESAAHSDSPPIIIRTAAVARALVLAADGRVVPILAASGDWPGVLRAVGDLQADFGRVTGAEPNIVLDALPEGTAAAVIVGTIGRSPVIDGLIATGKLQAVEVAGRWEAYRICQVDRPLPGVDRALVIAGADKRGTIFGIYELSGAIGVSPWYWWADVPARPASALYAVPNIDISAAPAVKYRGIFLNDEYPALTRWVQAKFGAAPGLPGNPAPKDVVNYGKGFYTRLFELLLRLKANYLWPAMWNNAFNEDDPDNARLADDYGIVMGNSHQEPMLRAQKEWDRRYLDSVGRWNYAKHPELLEGFWREGIERNKDYESLVTIGLRGANDTEMASGGPKANRALLEKIVERQRDILTEATGKPIEEIPQIWCLYKEVQEYYESGMRVPDDVTLLWAEDNWGNQRRLPTAAERKRPGGAGIYYHFDYHGGPRSYQWINTTSIAKIWDQMSLARQYGADRVWIVNVGHFKGYEYPLSFFMDLAWAPERFSGDSLAGYTRAWLSKLFSAETATEAAAILETLTRFNSRRKPESLRPDTYSLVHYGEADRVLSDWRALAGRAHSLAERLPEREKSAFYELILFPVRASVLLGELYIVAGRNALWAAQRRFIANGAADRVRELFSEFVALMDHFNTKFEDGKWDHFMDQAVLGYTSWNDPPANNIDHLRLAAVEPEAGAVMGVAVEGALAAWPGTREKPALPRFDSYNRQDRYIDVFSRGETGFPYTATASDPWIVVDKPAGSIDGQTRLLVKIDWDQAPSGLGAGSVAVAGAGAVVLVAIESLKPPAPPPAAFAGFIELNGLLSVEAEHFTARIDTAAGRWTKVYGFGKTLSGLRAYAAADTAAFHPGADAPCLEYAAWFFDSGGATVRLTVSPVLNFITGRDIRVGVSVDDGMVDIKTIVTADYQVTNANADWNESVLNNARFVDSHQTIVAAGAHTVKIWMIDPGLVLERFTVDLGGLRPSYLGPPESPRLPALIGRQ